MKTKIDQPSRSLLILVPIELLKKFKEASNSNFKTVSESIRDLMQYYVKKNEKR